MARKRKSNTGLPPCVYRKNGGYHLVKNNKWQKIGTTYAEMMRTYAALTEPSAPGAEPRTVGHLLDRYLVERSPLKASATQSTHPRDIRQLRAVFGDVLLSDVRPEHCGQYFRARACFASARREVALMSDAMSWACLEGWMSFNPFKGINKAQFRQSLARQEVEQGLSDPQVSPFDYVATQTHATPMLGVALDISALTGLRPIDVIRLRREWVRRDGLFAIIGKSSRWNKPQKVIRVLFDWTPGLRCAVRTALDLRTGIESEFLVCTEAGTQYTSSGLESLFQQANKAAADWDGAGRFQFYDLRRTIAGSLTQLTGLELAQWQLAHASAQTTAIYAKMVRRLPALDCVLDNLRRIRRETDFVP